MAKFIIVRHGQTKGTENNKYYGRTDLPLSRSGICQVKRIRKNMGKLNFDYIYTSPLKRCSVTAEILRLKKTIPLETANDLVEIDFGDWEGLTLLQMKERNYRKFNKYLYDFANFHMPNGESVKNMIKRARRFWESILHKHKKGNILIVTHGGPAKIIIMDTLGLPLKNFWRFNLSTAAVSVLETFNNMPAVKAINLWGRLS